MVLGAEEERWEACLRTSSQPADFTLTVHWDGTHVPAQATRTRSRVPILYIIKIYLLGASLMAQVVKNLPVMWETWIQSLDQEDPLEKGMATHSSILACRIPWIEEPVGSKITADDDYSHEIRRCLLFGRRAMTNIEIGRAHV